MSVNLAKLGIGLKKPNKEAAQHIVKELAEKYPDSAYELAKLYLHFMPTPPKKPKNTFHWVAMAVGKKDARMYINYVYVTAERMMATNGWMLHVAPNSDNLEPGFYLPNGDKIFDSREWPFPDVDEVIIDKAPAKYNIEVIEDNYSIGGKLFPRVQVDATLVDDAELTIEKDRLRIDLDDKISIIGEVIK